MTQRHTLEIQQDIDEKTNKTKALKPKHSQNLILMYFFLSSFLRLRNTKIPFLIVFEHKFLYISEHKGYVVLMRLLIQNNSFQCDNNKKKLK